MQLLILLADYYEEDKKLSKSIEYLCRALEIDDYSEEIYFRLISIYHKIGNRPMVKKTYETCKNKLEVELECPLTEKTEALYRQIMA